MEPKQKAEELVDKMLFCYQGHIDEYTAKQCALIAVDEIINNGGTLYVIEYPPKTFSNGTKYWKEVKQEIEKL
jgi:hypothetical protein